MGCLLAVAAGLAASHAVIKLTLVPATDRLSLGPQVVVIPAALLVVTLTVGSLWRFVAHGRWIARWLVAVTAGLILWSLNILVEAAALSQTVDYVRPIYRAWALGYVALICGVLTFLGVALAAVRPERAFLAAAIAGGILISIGQVLISGSYRVALAIALGVLAGLVASAAWRSLSSEIRGTIRLRPVWLLPIFLVVLTFLLRAGFGLQLLGQTGPGMPFAIASDDGDTYYTRAMGIVDDPTNLIRVLAGSTFAPGYPIVLAGILKLLDQNFAALVIVQALAAGFTALLVYQLARRLGGHAVGSIACGLFALDPSLIQIQATLTAEALGLPLLILAGWSLMRWDRDRQYRWLLLLGIALAGGFLARNVLAIFIPASLVWIGASSREGMRTALARIAVVLAIASLGVLAPLYATWTMTGSPRSVHQEPSMNWSLTSGPWEHIAPSNAPLVARGIEPFGRPVESLAVFVSEPIPVLAFLAEAGPRRALTLLFHPDFGFFDPLAILNGARVPNEYYATVQTVLTVALCLGTVGLAKNPARRLWIVWGALAISYLLLFSLVFAPLHPVRYRALILPFVVVFQAQGLAAVFAATRRLWLSNGSDTFARRSDDARSPDGSVQR